MYKFFSKKGEVIYSSDNLSLVEKEAKSYKEKNNLSVVEICTGKGKFFKWI